MKRSFTILSLVILWALSLHAQTPTLNQFFGKNGIDKNRNGAATGVNNTIFTLDPQGYPRGVTPGSLIVMAGAWPDSESTGNNDPASCAAHCLPSFSDNKSNTWNAVFSTSAPCKDANNTDHGIYYAQNVAAGTNAVTDHHPAQVTNEYWNISSWYSVATSSVTDGSSCTIGINPTNNTAPNISGTPITTTQPNDLIYVAVHDDSIGGDNGSSGNAWQSITVPSGCTLLEEDSYMGHADFYCIKAAAGSFTPQFTVAQGSHDTFTIMAVAFKEGNGGSAPSTGSAILLSAQTETGGPATYKQNVGCPTGTQTFVVTDDASYISNVTDSSGDAFTHVTPGGGVYGSIWYKTGFSIANPNTFVVNVVSPGGGVDLITFYCLNTTQIDTGVTPGSGSNILVAPGSVENNVVTNQAPANGQGNYPDLPTLTPSLPGALYLITGGDGVGPVLSCYQPANCVSDFPSPSNLPDVSGGDANDYTNGDLGGHYWQSGTGQINFGWTAINNSAGVSVQVTAFYAPVSSGTPAPPTNLTVTVQ